MSELKSPRTGETGFDRRSIMKGAAWSVPIIAAAIAAPAAAASERTETALVDYAAAIAAPAAAAAARTKTASFDNAAQNVVTYVQLGKETVKGHSRTGTGPTGFHIQNRVGITGTIPGLITITPDVADAAAPGVGIRKLPKVWDSPALTANVFTASFSYTAGVPSNRPVSFPVDFYYSGKKNDSGGKKNDPARSFTMNVSLTLPGGKGLSISSALTLGSEQTSLTLCLPTVLDAVPIVI